MYKFVLVLFIFLLTITDAQADGKIVFMIGEREYGTEQTLRDYFEKDLAPLGFEATFVTAPSQGQAKHDFPGLEAALEDADLLVLSVRRRSPTTSQLASVRKHLRDGKPLIGIRTASHPFDTRGDSAEGHAQWPNFDVEVLGAKYSGHYGDELFEIEIPDDVVNHPVLDDVKLGPSTKLYKGEMRSPEARLLLQGRRPNGDVEPIAWTHVYGPNKASVFYTSLGVRQDFEQEGFRRLLLNAVQQAVDSATPAAKNSSSE